MRLDLEKKCHESRKSFQISNTFPDLTQSDARPGELCRAQISDVDWDKGRITLAEHKTARKTGKPRVIPIGKNFGQTLQRAIDHRQTGPVFLSPKGEPWSVGNLSTTHRRLRDAAGLPRDLVLYLARHRFGTEALRAGVPLKDVAELMGHVSVTTTEIYLHRDVTELAGSQDRLPPVWDGESPAAAG